MSRRQDRETLAAIESMLSREDPQLAERLRTLDGQEPRNTWARLLRMMLIGTVALLATLAVAYLISGFLMSAIVLAAIAAGAVMLLRANKSRSRRDRRR